MLNKAIVPEFKTLQDRMLEQMIRDLGSGEESWRQYIDPDPVRWIQTHFYIPETKKPMELHESQIIPLREALSVDENGLMKYSTVVWGSIKKSAKSSIAAAVVLWMMWQDEWRSGKIVASDLKQAQSRVFSYAKRAIRLHPEWRNLCRVTQTRIYFPNNSMVEAIPMDPEGEAGGNDDIVSYTEIWSWKSDKAQRMWTESTLSPTKFGKSVRWLDTYAGMTGESLVLEPLYKKAVKGSETNPDQIINKELEMYAIRDSRLFVLWNTRPRLPYQTAAYYNQERTSLTASEFSRVHENAWVSSEDAFTTPILWDACRATEGPDWTNDDPMILVADAGVTNDNFGLLGISGDNDGYFYTRYVRRWLPPKDGRIDFNEVEQEIRRLCEEYNIIELAVDEYQLAQMSETLERDLIVNVHRFPQGKQREIADKRLQDAIRDRKVRHRGEPHLREHVLNANSKTQGENKIRIVKRSQELKIDLCVCLAMAVDRAVSWNL